MEKYKHLSEDQLKVMLSEYFGYNKRIPLTTATILSDSLALVTWYVSQRFCEGHPYSTLPGSILLEAASQAVIVLFKACEKFPDHTPMLRGWGKGDIGLPVFQCDNLSFHVSIRELRGKKGTADVLVETQHMMVAEFKGIRFRANKKGALQRLERRAATG